MLAAPLPRWRRTCRAGGAPAALAAHLPRYRRSLAIYASELDYPDE